MALVLTVRGVAYGNRGVFVCSLILNGVQRARRARQQAMQFICDRARQPGLWTSSDAPIPYPLPYSCDLLRYAASSTTLVVRYRHIGSAKQVMPQTVARAAE